MMPLQVVGMVSGKRPEGFLEPGRSTLPVTVVALGGLQFLACELAPK